MSDIKARNSMLTHYFGATVPYGNASILSYHLETNAIGAVVNGDSTDAIADGDVIDLGELPEGFLLDDAQLFVIAGATASVTASLGFKYEDGVDDAEIPQDAEYFLAAGADLATAGRLRADGGKLVILPKTARLILTVAGAVDQESAIRVTVTGELTGAK